MNEQAALRSLPIAEIRPSPFQYRTRFDDEKQRQLVESLRSTGLSTPILVRPLAPDGAFELVSGERRWRAAQELSWESIQGLCEEMTDAEAAARAVTENEIRSDANIMEKAAGYKRLTEPPCNFSLEEIARRYGWNSGASVKRLVDLLEEPEPIQELLSRDRIGEGHVRYLSRIKDAKERVRMARRAAEKGWTVKITEERVAKKLGDAQPKSSESKEKSATKGASYEDDYNHFHCALFGEEIEIGGRRFKMNEEMMDQYLSDYRSALQSFVRDVRERSAAKRAPETSSDLTSSIDPRAAELSAAPASLPTDAPRTSAEIAAQVLKGAAAMKAAGQSIKDLLSGLAKKPAPTSPDPAGGGVTPVKPPE